MNSVFRRSIKILVVSGVMPMLALLPGCPASQELVLVDGHGVTMLVLDRFGNIRPRVPIRPETDPESGHLDETNEAEFLVKDAFGSILARATGAAHAIYLKGCLERVPELEASGSAAEFVVRDATGAAQALIDDEGNLKYRGHIAMLLLQTVSSTEYTPGGTLDVTLTLEYYDEAAIFALGVISELPEGWTYNSWLLQGDPPSIAPQSGDSTLNFAWVQSMPNFPVTLSYRVNVPGDAQGEQQICAQALYRTGGRELHSGTPCAVLNQESEEGEGGSEEGEGGGEEMQAGQPGEDVAPSSVSESATCQTEVVFSCDFHSADQDYNWTINLSELLRVIQFFNSDGYHCQSGTEDGYAPGPGDQACTPHKSDYNGQDWQVSLSELLRLIQFFNSQCYIPHSSGEDGYAPSPWETDEVLLLAVGEMPSIQCITAVTAKDADGDPLTFDTVGTYEDVHFCFDGACSTQPTRCMSFRKTS